MPVAAGHRRAGVGRGAGGVDLGEGQSDLTGGDGLSVVGISVAGRATGHHSHHQHDAETFHGEPLAMSGRLSANGARGEVVATLAGEERRLCLTLGALAEIETGLGVSGIAALGARMRILSARDLMIVLAALLRGGGEDGLADDLGRAAVDPREAAEAVARAFAAAGQAGG